ncbi:hypothetical protein [Prevotella sp. P5-64]|uniref:hypothetical protein n=1 Tax=Prevotella sp. P5-64 TaxID=2024226 RepID=UPI00117D0DB5|nr:hypothetical protein [Prevotella sp. P5-64]
MPEVSHTGLQVIGACTETSFGNTFLQNSKKSLKYASNMAKNLTYTMKDVFCAVRQFLSQRCQFYSIVIVKSVSQGETMNSDPEPIISQPERNNSNPHFPTKAIAVSLV